MEIAVASGGCTIRDLPPSKRFKYVSSSHLGSTPCLPLPAKKRVFPPLPETAAVSVCLPAKKRAYALPAAAEGTVPVCLPPKKRAYAPSLDAIVPACLPAKKRMCGPPPPPPPDTDASACVQAKKRVHALAPPPEDAASSHCIPAKKRAQAPPAPEDDAASVPVCLPANKRVMPPFIPPSSSPSVESDGARIPAVKEVWPQRSNKRGGATSPRVVNDVGDYARAEASKMPDKPKEVKEQVPMKSRGANAVKRAKDLECKKSCNVVNGKQPEVQVEVFKKAEKAIDPKKLACGEESRREAEEVARERKQEAVEDEDDGVHCAVCGSTDGDPSDPIVFCDGCDLMVHASCYGNPLDQSIPDGDWFCSLCSAKAKKGKPARPGCCLCPAKGGAMKRTTDGRWAHIACALLVPEVFFRDPDGRDGIDCSRVPGHRFTKECYICESSRGCALECSQPKCCLGFHVSCGLNGDLCIEYREEKGGAVVAGFCREHTKLWEKIIRKGFYQTKNVEHKRQVDLVTETDRACEDLIFNHLRKHYPDHKLIGEETSAALGATADLTEDPTWIVDPLDGTTNFVHGFPFVCVSIGLTIGKIPTVGVVYNPIMNELFIADRGKGAFLNGSPIKTSSQNELLKALLVTEKLNCGPG